MIRLHGAAPVRACRYCRDGRCTYAESRNPGLDPGLRCAVLAALTEKWDDFLDRAELFGLSESAASRIWNNRTHGSVFTETPCPGMAREAGVKRPAGLPDIAECPYRADDACLLSMPGCSGRCEHFDARGRHE